MQQIFEPNALFVKICGEQKKHEPNAPLSRFALRIPCEDGVLLYHTLSRELLLLSEEELQSPQCDNYLFSHWFRVAPSLDEYQMAMGFRKVAPLLLPKKEGITSFTVFPTTDCNARCFYCYELGRKRVNMTDAVAKDAAAYISRVRKGQNVSLTWFGGEPLFNKRAIGILCAELRRLGVPFSSQMVTNAFLFDEPTVREAVETWRLTAAQITIDGTEEIYNRTKAYQAVDKSAFLCVMGNIDLLLKNGVKVVLRLNLNRENESDLYALSDQLMTRFSGENKPEIYAVLLKNFGRDVKAFSDAEQAISACDALNAYIAAHGYGRKKRFRRDLRFNRCMADSDNSLTILPDGSLGKCEHESERFFVGSIYAENLDTQEIARWKERIVVPACKTCPLASVCVALKRCAWDADGCTEEDRRMKLGNVRRAILGEYDHWKEQHT